MANTKEIQRRIKSVNNIKKITKAMEMVAAAKMRKAIEAVLRTRTYANLSWETILRLANGQTKENHILLQAKETVKKVAIILMTSNRGLCGGFNANLINKIIKSTKQHKDYSHEFILVGKKGGALTKYGQTIIAEFPKADLVTGVNEISALAQMIIVGYEQGDYDKVLLAYTDFVNSTKQVPRIKQLLPVDINAQDDYLGVVGQSSQIATTKEYIVNKKEAHDPNLGYEYDYLFEPNAQEVLAGLVPQLIKVQLFQALLESNASEHSARMSTMHQATEAAGDIVADLTLSFNKARQASITSEIAEISAGANALAD